MASPLRPIWHEDRLSLVEHLGELRNRLIVCIVAFTVTTGVCLWQNHAVLNLINRPLERATSSKTSKDPLQAGARFDQRLKGYLQQSAAATRELAARERDPQLRRDLEALSRSAAQVAAAAPKVSAKRPVTLGVGEPFTATLKVAAMAGFLLALPILLYQAYAFVLPAFSPKEREVALPVMLAVPFLFVAGVVFGYYLVLPPAIRFLQNFNNDSYQVLIQARDYYNFSI